MSRIIQIVTLLIDSEDEKKALTVLKSEDSTLLYNFQIEDRTKSKLMSIKLFYRFPGSTRDPNGLTESAARETNHLVSTLREELNVANIDVIMHEQVQVGMNKAMAK